MSGIPGTRWSRPENVRKALARVRRNKGAPGIDGMTVEELGAWLKEHWPETKSRLLDGAYEPQPLRRVEIPKASGGVRPLGVSTALDRFIQQAVMQVLQGDWDGSFPDAANSTCIKSVRSRSGWHRPAVARRADGSHPWGVRAPRRVVAAGREGERRRSDEHPAVRCGHLKFRRSPAPSGVCTVVCLTVHPRESQSRALWGAGPSPSPGENSGERQDFRSCGSMSPTRTTTTSPGQAVARWEKGKSRIDGPSDRLLRLLYIQRYSAGTGKVKTLLERLAELDNQSEALVQFENDNGWHLRIAA